MSGVLYVVATPIGNLSDISSRALDMLRHCALIAAEDTRHSRRLLDHYSINAKLKAYHQHNEAAMSQSLLARLQAGDDIALISDAGTPLISDPGYKLVDLCLDNGIKVSPIPGACALISALSVSGLATSHFGFYGFLPAKTHAKTVQLEQFKELTSTQIFYESPHRLLQTLSVMQGVYGEQRQACVARELTKTFEHVLRGSLVELYTLFESGEEPIKGEFVIIIAGAEPVVANHDQQLEQTLIVMLAEVPLKQAVKITQQLTGLPRNEVYQAALALKQ